MRAGSASENLQAAAVAAPIGELSTTFVCNSACLTRGLPSGRLDQLPRGARVKVRQRGTLKSIHLVMKGAKQNRAPQ
jgi:hypothetical protein